MERDKSKSVAKVHGSSALETSHPHVDEHILAEIYKINPRFVLEWELQVTGFHRWHVKLHRSPGMSDLPEHVLLLVSPEHAGPQGEYVPVDQRAVSHLAQIMVWSQDPVKFVEDVLRDEQAAKDSKDKNLENEIEDWANHYRRLFARLADNTPDCRWSPGISRNPDGSYSAGQAPISRAVTKAV